MKGIQYLLAIAIVSTSASAFAQSGERAGAAGAYLAAHGLHISKAKPQTPVEVQNINVSFTDKHVDGSTVGMKGKISFEANGAYSYPFDLEINNGGDEDVGDMLYFAEFAIQNSATGGLELVVTIKKRGLIFDDNAAQKVFNL